jgi:hypothetical protein
VQVQIASEGGPELGDVVGQGDQLGVGLLQLGQVLGNLTLVRLDDDGGRLGADAFEVLQRVGADLEVELLVAEAVDDRRGRAERAYPVAGLAGALQEEGDPPERGRGRERSAQLLTFLADFFARFWALAARFWAFSKLFSVEVVAFLAARRAR